MRSYTMTLIAAFGLMITPAYAQDTAETQITSSEKLDATQAPLANPFQADPSKGVFAVVTDIHFDPYSSRELAQQLNAAPVSQWASIFNAADLTDYSGYGSDANEPLMRSALEYAGSLASIGLNPDYVLYTGDYLSHGFEEDYTTYVGGNDLEGFAVKTTQFVSNRVAAAFNNVPSFGVIGNTDSACGDYEVEPMGDYLAGLRSGWQTDSRGSESGFENFELLGSYVAPQPTVADQDIIVLNNIFWSSKYSDACGSAQNSPGQALMGWLELQLFQSAQAGRTAQILLHIPPGINAYSTASGFGSCHARIIPFWSMPYTDQFLDLMRRYEGVVVQTFSGHTHMDGFTVLPREDGTPMISAHIAPSVSPVFNNNPAVAFYQYDRSTGLVLDEAVFYLTNLAEAASGATGQWSLEYVFQAEYSVSDMSAVSMAQAATAIQSGGNEQNSYLTQYAVTTSASGPITSQNQTAFTCALTGADVDSYAACYCSSPYSTENE